MKPKIGFLVREYRLNHSLSQQELSRRTGISQAVLSNIETQKPGYKMSVQSAEALAEAMGMSLSELVERTDFNT